MLPQELIRAKRDGQALSEQQIQAFVDGLASDLPDDRWGDAQAAAMAMAIVWRGMDTAETVALTRAMTASGEVLSWADAGLPGPVVDKHSTGGVGDKVSLMLAPMLAACGAVVPMISGRGLGHTGGTLDKLESLPGYRVDPDRATLLATLREAGCAIVGASARLAPADRRLYALRDVTATVESVPLITASILSKKLAAGLQALVLDVKVGNGAFMAELPPARALARSLVDVARGAGLPAVALLTAMDQPLGPCAGNALEVAETIDFLIGTRRDARLLEVTLALGADLLVLAGLCPDIAEARQRLQAALDSGHAAERFERMVARLGGPARVLQHAALPRAPVQHVVLAPRGGTLRAVDTRAVGLAVVALGGGRQRPGEAIDPRVGFAGLQPLGTAFEAGQALATVHAATEHAAEAAAEALLAAVTLDDGQRALPAPLPTVLERIV